MPTCEEIQVPADCPSYPWCPLCIEAGCPPGGPGGVALLIPGKPQVGSPGTFYNWENGQELACAVVGLPANGNVDIVARWANGEVYKSDVATEGGLPVFKNQAAAKKYVKERKEWLEILSRHMLAFGVEWTATGKPIPAGGFSSDGNGLGTYFLPFHSDFDCPAQVLQTNTDATVDLRILFKSGNGWANIRSVHVFTSEAEITASKLLTAEFETMHDVHYDAAEAEWDQYLAAHGPNH